VLRVEGPAKLASRAGVGSGAVEVTDRRVIRVLERCAASENS
jgi:hypothetical protein